jgi:hypothetical protein
MTQIVVVDGPAQILVGVGGGGSLVNLGLTVNGAEIVEDAFIGDVPGDANGGDVGPPIDMQYFGQIDRIRMELSTWDPAVVDQISPRLNGASPGIISTPGSLIAANGYGYRVLILPTVRPRNYLFCVPKQPITRNKGTRFSRLVLEFEAHSVLVGSTPTLWNTATS